MPRFPHYTRWTARRRPEWIRSAVLGVAALALGIFLGLWWVFPPAATQGPSARPGPAGFDPPDLAAPGGPAQPGPQPPDAAAAGDATRDVPVGEVPASAPNRPPRIGPGTELVYRTLYRETGKVVGETSTPTRDMVNLSEELLRRLYPQYRVEEFGEDRVVLVSEQDGPDPETLAEEQRDYRTIRAIDGVVAVFAGRRHRADQPLLQRTSLLVDAFPENVRNSLAEGIEVRGDEELARYLEGLSP